MTEHNQISEFSSAKEETGTPDEESKSVADESAASGYAPISSNHVSTSKTLANDVIAAKQTSDDPAVADIKSDHTQESIPESTLLNSTQTGNSQLPNGMVGKSYEVTIGLKEWGFKQQPVLHPAFKQQLKQLGLDEELDGLTLRIAGTPILQGEHSLLLYYSYNDEKIAHKKITWLVNADPKSLWKDIEPDDKLPHRKPHINTGRVVSRDFQLIAASRRGRSHAHEGKFREDDFAISETSDGWHVLLVADGAGSASLSREGSRLACTIGAQSSKTFIAKHLASNFEALLDSYIKPETMEEAEKEIKRLLYHTLCGAAFDSYKAIEQQATKAGHPANDYATTFLLSIAKKFRQGTFVAAFWIGDGAICLYAEEHGSTSLLGTPDGGDFSGQTRFLTMRDLIANSSEMLGRIHFRIVENPTALILMTDGISDPKFGTDKNLLSREKWIEFWHELSAEVDFNEQNDAAPQQLLNWMDFWSPGEHDDRTMAILCGVV